MTKPSLLNSLIDYVDDVKPYHVKIRELMNELIFSDTLNISVTDAKTLNVYLQNIWTSNDVGGFELYSISGGQDSDRYFKIPDLIFPRFSLNDSLNQTNYPQSYPGQTPPGDDPASTDLGGTLNGGFLASEQPWPVITAGSFITNVYYTIVSVNSTNFTLIGAASNTAGVTFLATGPGTGTGTAIRRTSSHFKGINQQAVIAPIVRDPFLATLSQAGITYTIYSTGTTNFTLIGAANSNPGTQFTATGPGAGTGLIVLNNVNVTNTTGSVVGGPYKYVFYYTFQIDPTEAITYGFGRSTVNGFELFIKSLTDGAGTEIQVPSSYISTSDDVYYVAGPFYSEYTPTGSASMAVDTIAVGNVYTIVSVGNTNFTLIGASSSAVGVVFTATGVGSGTGTVGWGDLLSLPTPSAGNVTLFCKFGELKAGRKILPYWTNTGRYMVPYHEGSRVYLNGSTVPFGTTAGHYVVDETRGWIQFTTFPAATDEIDINLMKTDRLFISKMDPFDFDISRTYDMYGYDDLPYGVETITAATLVAGQTYTIMTTGTTDFTLVGATNSNPGTQFVATGLGSGTGTVALTVASDYFTITVTNNTDPNGATVVFNSANSQYTSKAALVPRIAPSSVNGDVWKVTATGPWTFSVVQTTGSPVGPAVPAYFKTAFSNGKISFIISPTWSSYYFSPDTNNYQTILPAVASAALVVGSTYTILVVGNSDFTLAGAASNTVGVTFLATRTTTGTGTATLNIQRDPTHYLVNLLVQTEHGVVTDPTPPTHAPVQMVSLGKIKKIKDTSSTLPTMFNGNPFPTDYYSFVLDVIPRPGTYIELRVEQQNQFNPWLISKFKDSFTLTQVVQSTGQVIVSMPSISSLGSGPVPTASATPTPTPSPTPSPTPQALVPGLTWISTDVSSSATYAGTVALTFNTNGTIVVTSTQSSPLNWYLPTTAGIGSTYYIRFTNTSNNTFFTGEPFNTWHQVDVARSLTAQNTANTLEGHGTIGINISIDGITTLVTDYWHFTVGKI